MVNPIVAMINIPLEAISGGDEKRPIASQTIIKAIMIKVAPLAPATNISKRL